MGREKGKAYGHRTEESRMRWEDDPYVRPDDGGGLHGLGGGPSVWQGMEEDRMG
jgi:hypothetical protein